MQNDSTETTMLRRDGNAGQWTAVAHDQTESFGASWLILVAAVYIAFGMLGFLAAV